MMVPTPRPAARAPVFHARPLPPSFALEPLEGRRLLSVSAGPDPAGKIYAVALWSPSAAPASLALTVADTPQSWTYTLTAHVSQLDAFPRGNVTFRENNVTLGVATLRSGPTTLRSDGATLCESLATLTLAFTPGPHSVTLSYSGDALFAPVSSDPLSVTEPLNEGLTASSPQIVSAGRPVTLTAAVAHAQASLAHAALPTGAITFRLGNTDLVTLPLDASAQVAWTTADLPAGSYDFTLLYSGDALWAPQTLSGLHLDILSPGATSFVGRAYQTLLARSADTAGLNYWSAQLSSGALTSSQVIAGLIGSTEYRTNAIRRLYRDALGRDAEPAGIDAWLGFFAAGGTIEGLSAALYGSQEYFNLQGATTAGVVQSFYRNVLARDAEPAGLAYWLDQIDQRGLSRGLAALQFLNSPENNRLLVRNMYLDYLHRLPADAEIDFWANRLTPTTGRAALYIDFLGSPEYFNQ